MTSTRPLLSRLLAGLLLALSALATGCDDDDKKSPATQNQASTAKGGSDNTDDDARDDEAGDKEDAPASAATRDVTGVWTYKHETMRLKQTGSSIQGTTEAAGFVVNPADPIEHPVRTPGSMAEDGTVKLAELVTYLANPAKSFNVVKVGRLKDANTLVLQVVSGQAAHTQTWIRKK
jgi:hypothetical protein